jgi:hypothetical protein
VTAQRAKERAEEALQVHKRFMQVIKEQAAKHKQLGLRVLEPVAK